MRILHVGPYSDAAYGGPVSTLSGLALAQAEAGDDVMIATLRRPGGSDTPFPEAAASGVDVRVLGTGRGPLLSGPGTRRVDALVRDCDIVHVHGVWEDLVARALASARAAGTPTVLRPCGMLTAWSIGRHARRKRLLWAARTRASCSVASAVHFASTQERAETSLLPAPGQRTFVEPNGIAIRGFDGGDAARFRREHSIAHSAIIMLFLGRLHPGKGLEALIAAHADIGDDRMLVLAGPADSAYTATLQRIARDAGNADRIVFTGMLGPDARRDALAAASLFVLPSEHESFGNAALEALAAGTPVLLSDRVPVGDIVTACGGGAVCPPTREGIALALRTRVTVTADIARACAAPFDWNLVASRIRQHYVQIIGGAES